MPTPSEKFRSLISILNPEARYRQAEQLFLKTIASKIDKSDRQHQYLSLYHFKKSTEFGDYNHNIVYVTPDSGAIVSYAYSFFNVQNHRSHREINYDVFLEKQSDRLVITDITQQLRYGDIYSNLKPDHPQSLNQLPLLTRDFTKTFVLNTITAYLIQPPQL